MKTEKEKQEMLARKRARFQAEEQARKLAHQEYLESLQRTPCAECGLPLYSGEGEPEVYLPSGGKGYHLACWKAQPSAPIGAIFPSWEDYD